MTITLDQVLRAASVVPAAMVAILLFHLGRYLGDQQAAHRPWPQKLAACAVVLLAGVMFSYFGGTMLGTHTENCDPYGCDRVVDYVPSDRARVQYGLDEFFVITPSTLVGFAVGAWSNLGRTKRP